MITFVPTQNLNIEIELEPHNKWYDETQPLSPMAASRTISK